MLPKISPRNDEWNRKFNFIDERSEGFFIETKNGITFFGWKFLDADVRFYQCEQPVFEKHFDITSETVQYKIESVLKINFLRYPVSV